jgi:hypothetical protein
MIAMHRIPVTIANILIEIKTPYSASEMGIEKRLGGFMGEPDDPVSAVSIVWEESAGEPVPMGEMIYDPGEIWQMYRHDGNYYAAINYLSDHVAGGSGGVLRSNSTWDTFTLTEPKNGANWESVLNIGASELVLRTKILFDDGLVFHACGVDDNGRGIVFSGHSGAGKSTLARLWTSVSGVIGMNDDRIAIRADKIGPICYGTPWGGQSEIARNHSSPLSAIFLVEQALENNIKILSPSVSAPMLLARAFLPYWDRDLMERALANMNRILRTTPVYLLRCRPEAEVIPLVRSIL